VLKPRMSWTEHIAHMIVKKCTQSQSGNLKEKKILGHQGVDGKARSSGKN
jgi:hypothetical protein